MTMFATTPRRNRRVIARLALVGVAILLGACAGESSPSVSHQQATSSKSEQPSVPTATAEPSEAAMSVPPSDVTTVTIRDRSFGAPEVTVALGTAIFVNADTLPHTVTEGQNGAAAPNARFNEVVGVSESVKVTFAEPGDYQITCLFHSEMHLLVHAH